MTESPKDLAREAHAGRSERTPAIALSGITLGVGAFAAVLIAVCLILYFVLR